jgi:lysophospholipase L1-like esterase
MRLRSTLTFVLALLTLLTAGLAGAIPSAGALTPKKSATILSTAHSYMGLVATRGSIAQNQAASTSKAMSRTYHKATATLRQAQLVWPNWFVNGSFIESGSGGTLTITAAVEYPPGSFTQITFSGSATSPPAANGANIVSDFITLAQPIPEGAIFYVRTFAAWGAGGSMIYGPLVQLGNGEGTEFGAAITDKTMGGAVGGTAGQSLFGPLAVLGKTRKPSILVLGDSKQFGQNDTADATGDLGETARALGAAGLGYINAGKPSDKAASFVASHAHRVADLAPYVTHVIGNYSVNDVAAARTATQILADIDSIAGYYTALGKKVSWNTLSPETTSTDGFTTTTNQTAATNFSTTGTGTRETINDALRAGRPSLSWTNEVADQVESARNSGRWKAPGFTADGTHPTQSGYLTIKNSGAINTNAIGRTVPLRRPANDNRRRGVRRWVMRRRARIAA